MVLLSWKQSHSHLREKTKRISRQCVTKMFEVATPTFKIMYIVLLSLRQITSHLTLSQSISLLSLPWLGMGCMPQTPPMVSICI